MIRRAIEKDIPKVQDLLSQVLEVHANGRPDIFIHGTTKYTAEELKDIFANEKTPVFVYVDENDEALGYAFCIHEEIRNENNLHDRDSIYIDDICVDEKHRGKHIATALFEHVKEYAKACGCYNITLNVWTLNGNAKKFYESMGMKPLKTVMEAIL